MKSKTTAVLDSMYDTILQPSGKKHIQDLRTAHGGKDSYFENFVESILSAGGRRRGENAAAACRKKAATFSGKNLYSPIWCIKGKPCLSSIRMPASELIIFRPRPAFQHTGGSASYGSSRSRQIHVARCSELCWEVNSSQPSSLCSMFPALG
jgi:hypothetical protein